MIRPQHRQRKTGSIDVFTFKGFTTTLAEVFASSKIFKKYFNVLNHPGAHPLGTGGYILGG
jgi:hypothetical protein